MSLHFSELLAVLRECGLPTDNADWRDRSYSVANDAFYRGVVHPAYVQQSRSYVDEAFDCEDMADEFCMIARRLHADNPGRKEKAGLAVATISYIPGWNNGVGHAIAVCITGKPGKRKALLYDGTQRDFVAPLTKAELASIYGGPRF